MFNKALVSPIALAFGLALTGAAAAQTMVGDQDVSDADLVAVQAYCDELSVASSTSSGGETPTVSADSSTLGVELSTITIQHCVDAGLIDGPAAGLTPSVNTGSPADPDVDENASEESTEEGSSN